MEVAHVPKGRGCALIAVFLSIASVVTVTFALRIYVQLRILKRRSTWEDYFAGAGWLFFLGVFWLHHSSILLRFGTTFVSRTASINMDGLEGEIDEQKALVETDVGQMTYLHELTFILANMVIKQSIALMLLRYAVEDYHKKLIYAVTFCVQVYSMILFFLVLLQCIPVSFYWTRAQGVIDGRCMDPEITIKATYGYSATFVLYDITMAILPWFMVRKLQLDLRTRMMLTTVLAFGSIACIVTVIRVPLIVKLGHTNDWLRDSAMVSILSCCETGLSFATSCAATLKSLFKRKSSHNTPRATRHVPRLNTIPTTIDGSCSTAATKQGDFEFFTAFYGTDSKV